MATPVELPKLGNTVEECLLSRWVKQKGETVAAGDIVVEIETDKTNFEIQAPVAGTVLDTFFKEGALVPVFTNLFVIGSPGENVEAFRPGRGAEPGQTETAVEERVGARGEGQGANTAPSAVTPHPLPLTPDVPRASYSPRARRYAAEHGLQEGADVRGSGPKGRVLEADVKRAQTTSGERKPAGGIRDTIARRMRESLSSTAQYTMHASADATALLAARARNKASSSLADVNINDLVTFYVVKALLDSPDLNAEYVNGQIVKHAEVHIGFATDTPRGLMVPVVRNAHALPLADLAARMKELAAKAVQGTISPDDLSGATFTVSNLGAFGVESFTPLINPPQVAILGVGAIQLKPVRKSGAVEFVDVIGLSLTCDHQVIDGAPGARFLRILKEKIESMTDA